MTTSSPTTASNDEFHDIIVVVVVIQIVIGCLIGIIIGYIIWKRRRNNSEAEMVNYRRLDGEPGTYGETQDHEIDSYDQEKPVNKTPGLYE